MKMLKRKIVVTIALMMVMILSACLVYAYGNQASGTIDGVTVNVSNYISADKKSASATTWTSTPLADASVSVTFYWRLTVYPYTEGTTTMGNGNYGEITVNAPSLANQNKEYYKVVSNHIAGYHGLIFSYPNLTTEVTP